MRVFRAVKKMYYNLAKYSYFRLLILQALTCLCEGYRRTRSDDGSLSPLRNNRLAQSIVSIHNQVRAQVSPPAANMLKMQWSHEAAVQAQSWAEQCQYGHNEKSHRRVQGLSCGQNLLRTVSGPFSWENVLKIWSTDEARSFRYGYPGNNMQTTGHYTQMVWASSYQVGCGYRNCGYWQIYVCHYCPSGNIRGEEIRPYQSGSTCSACLNDCEGNLCRNHCPHTNYYSNCDSISRRHDVCSRPGMSSFCGATCKCSGKIYS